MIGPLRRVQAWWSSQPLRARVACELSTLAALTAVFLVSFPRRTIAVDIPLALLALGLIGLNAGYTRDVIWARRSEREPRRRKGGALLLTLLTAPAMALFLLIGASIGYRAGGWTAAYARIAQGRILGAFAFYLLWALLQQTLFQFYLLGRLKRLLPGLPAIALCALNGLAFSFVHFPNPSLMLVTALAGTLWSYSYLEHGRLWPIALSHAALGSTFYYWVYGRDLAAVWLSLLPR